MRIATYVDVLNEAKAWRATNTKDALHKADEILRKAMEEFDDALPLGDERVLVLKGLGELDKATQLLRELESRFKQIGEETLCRWGSILKLRANLALKEGGLGAAEYYFSESERYYARAYEEHHTFFPRINQLTVRFVRAGLAKELGNSDATKLLQFTETDARNMLSDPTIWKPRKADDNVWSPASRGEACVLLRRWAEAEAAYSEAMHAAGVRQFYFDCMGSQIRDVLIPAFARLQLSFEGKLAQPDLFFRNEATNQTKEAE
jgi:hypothetical protein